MLFFNLCGLLGIALGCLATWSAVTISEQAGYSLTRGQLFLWSMTGCVFAAAVFGLLTDRCEIRGLFASYRQLIVQLCYEAFRQPVPPGYTTYPGRKLAFFCWPLAIGPLLLFTCSALAWAVDAFQQRPFATHAEHGEFVALTGATAALTWVFALVTKPVRLLQRHDD